MDVVTGATVVRNVRGACTRMLFTLLCGNATLVTGLGLTTLLVMVVTAFGGG